MTKLLMASAAIAAVLMLLGPKAAYSCSLITGDSMSMAPAVPACMDIFSSDITIHMPLDSCLVQKKNNPTRFYVVACRDAGSESCITDLPDGVVNYYERTSNTVVISKKPC